VKIVVSKASAEKSKGTIGVYVTFVRKEDAQKCITAVNGSQNGDRVLRAQLGTTKYCSAYLRNETCTNKACMFLHEPGDNDDSYSRQDLSSLNSVNTQRPLPAMASSSSNSRQITAAQAPIQQAQPLAAAAQPMAREMSRDSLESGDNSALPSSASWAKQRSRRGSHATSGATPSPAISQAMPATAESVEDPPEIMEEQQEPEDAGLPASVVTNDTPRPERDPVLVELLKSINSPLIFPSPATINANDADSSFPPLFDTQGGQKRRAIREQEEARNLEQESQGDLQSVTEPMEDEEPESGISGSLQLGGEPEDGSGREGDLPQGFHSQRRPSTQLPIQRSSNGGPFGPSLAQNYSNLSSINGRALTAQQQQQLLLFKSGQSQNASLDQYPPGIGNAYTQGSGLFPQPGHNRQSSRFDFGNGGSSSAATVKASANPKFLAQQSSMMPSGSHAQGSQFYGSSMQGPPPGLKSTGTPPIFGQGHNFGGGSLFNAKESNNDMLNMLRARGAASGSQVHDSKREYMFPSFLQYPSASSTPAPASGLQASLYGPQTGAFQDFGQKQKKKGKKHRHANTSSSGGGGLVDLADPSILQARMQHQQQSNAGVGQGLYGGQAQGGYNPNMMYGGYGRW
jgi:CCR4-NOT transcription complex subunit 4